MLNRSGTLTTGAAAWRSIVVATRPVYCVLALPAPASNLRHMSAIATDSFATLLPGLARLRRRELMSRTLPVSRPSTRGGDLPLSLVAHPRKTPAVAGRTPRAARAGRGLRGLARPAGRGCVSPRAGSGRTRLCPAGLRRARPARTRPARGLLRTGSLGFRLTLLAPDLVHCSGCDFLGAAAVPPGFFGTLFDVLILPLPLWAGSPWHSRSSFLRVIRTYVKPDITSVACQ